MKRLTQQTSFDGLSHSMIEFEHGEYVCYSDYVLLQNVNAELLEALRFVNEHCQLYGAADAAREKIEAAIAKAEGRQ